MLFNDKKSGQQREREIEGGKEKRKRGKTGNNKENLVSLIITMLVRYLPVCRTFPLLSLSLSNVRGILTKPALILMLLMFPQNTNHFNVTIK